MRMDISELLPVLGALLFAVLLLAVIPQLKRMNGRLLRVGGITLALLLALIALGAAGIVLYFNHTYTRRLPPQLSPDGKHVALVTYTVGDGSGVDIAEVSVRHTWSPYAHRVYAGPLRYQPDASPQEPDVQWIDGTHLLIRFHTLLDLSGNPLAVEQGCAPEADGIAIRCEENRIHVNLPGR